MCRQQRTRCSWAYPRKGEPGACEQTNWVLPERTEGNLNDGLVFFQLNSSGEGFSYSPPTPTLHAFPPGPCALSICPFLGKATLGFFFPPVNFFQLFIYVSSDLFLVNEFYALLLSDSKSFSTILTSLTFHFSLKRSAFQEHCL